MFESLVESVSTKWLIENHYLAPYKYYGVDLADTRNLHTKNGEFDKDEVERLMSRSIICPICVTAEEVRAAFVTAFNQLMREKK